MTRWLLWITYFHHTTCEAQNWGHSAQRQQRNEKCDLSFELNKCRIIHYSVSYVLLSVMYTDNVDNQTSKAVQGTLSIPPTVSQEFVFKQSKHTPPHTGTHRDTHTHAHTHMHCSLMNIAEQQAITHTSFISPYCFHSLHTYSCRHWQRQT